MGIVAEVTTEHRVSIARLDPRQGSVLEAVCACGWKHPRRVMYDFDGLLRRAAIRHLRSVGALPPAKRKRRASR